jgi:small GTP-binding protein
MNIVIIGHIDHGKSTLIGRLLFDTNSIPEALVEDVRAISKELGKEMEFSYLLDSLEEEREQNITIDTTQTFFSSDKRDYVIIDAPGHREFLKNMITGASMADAAVLIVDVNIGMEEQTKRHAYLANLLGLKHLIVVLNKMDTAGFAEKQFQANKAEVEAFLKTFGIAPRLVIPISAKLGENVATRSSKMPWYTGPALVEALDDLTPDVSAATRGLRLPLQDCYDLDGKKVFVGRIEHGEVRAGDSITALPSNKTYTVKSIEAWKQPNKTRAEAGESIGLTLDGSPAFARGEVLCSGAAPKMGTSFDATLFWMSATPLECNQEILLKCATQEVPCSLERIKTKLNSSSLEVLGQDCADVRETEVAQVKIKTKIPLVTEDFTQIEALGRVVFVRGDQIEGGAILA